jgi:serine/threonine protein kinase
LKDSAPSPLSGTIGARMAGPEKHGPLEVGQKFLKYAIREQIGRGGHAWVYHGHDPFLDNEVAIKILHRHGGVTEDMLRRGQAEAKLLFRLKHPNIVEVQDAGISDQGLLYIVMELLRGKSLRDVLRERDRLPLREALELFLDITSGVEAAHAFGAIHRDLKPENVFIPAEGTCKILDFGIAKVVDAAGITTERDVLHGTILYISPEQLMGHRATPRSDLYALGLVLFEALHGRHPLLLKGGDPTVRELSLMQTGLRPPPLDELDANIPRHVARIVERLLLKSPKQRTQSTQELRAALTESLRRLGEDDRSAQPHERPSVTDRIPMAHETERIPFAILPNRLTSSPFGIHAPTESLRPDERIPEPQPLADSSDVTPLRSKRSDVSPVAPGTRPITAPPLTTPVRGGTARQAGSEGELPQRRAARALGAGALVGVCVGAGYLGLHVRSAEHVRRTGSPAPTAEQHNEPVAVAPAEPSAETEPSAAAAPEALDMTATPGRPSLPESPAPATSSSHAKARKHQGAKSGHQRDDAEVLLPAGDPARKVWIE